jgi:hypothetical protein
MRLALFLAAAALLGATPAPKPHATPAGHKYAIVALPRPPQGLTVLGLLRYIEAKQLVAPVVFTQNDKGTYDRLRVITLDELRALEAAAQPAPTASPK